jgi:hypothetical protein
MGIVIDAEIDRQASNGERGTPSAFILRLSACFEIPAGLSK